MVGSTILALRSGGCQAVAAQSWRGRAGAAVFRRTWWRDLDTRRDLPQHVDLAARQRAVLSGREPLEDTGPMAIRVRLMTLCPSLASIRRISRFLPSASTSSSVVASPWVPANLARLARTLPSESQIPSVSLSRISRPGVPATRAAVGLLDPVPRMSQAVGQLAVVGQNHQPHAVLIEPADRVDPLRHLGQQVDHPGPARGVVVGRDVALGLVHGIVDHLLEPDPFAVHGDGRTLGIDPRAELADDLAIDRDPALEDVFLALPARAQPRMRQDFLKPLGLAAFESGSCPEPEPPGFDRSDCVANDPGPVASLPSPGRLAARRAWYRAFLAPPGPDFAGGR